MIVTAEYKVLCRERIRDIYRSDALPGSQQAMCSTEDR